MILDGKKNSDLGIQLASFPLDAATTVKALINIDETILDHDKIMKLKSI